MRTFESDDFAGGVHDGRVGWDGSSYRVGSVVEVDDDNLCGLTDLLPHADELIRLHRQRAESNVGRIDS